MKTFRHILAFAMLLFVFTPNNSFAQLVGGEAFLQGNFVQVGINERGSFGSFNTPPAGYNPSPAGSDLGFVADPDQDGFTVGTPPLCGDYFVPGNPEEAWGLTVDGTNYNNSRGSVLANDVPGALMNYNATATEISVDWEGTIGGGPANGLTITKTTTVPVDGLYFVTSVTLTNTTGATIPAVYYMRNVDPDNEQPLTGSFVTENTIVDQPGDPASNIDKALVQALGTTHGCYLGLGTRDCRAHVTHGGFSNRSALGIYNGTFLNDTPGATSTGDAAISLAFNIGDIPAGETRTLAYAYVLDAAQLDVALNAAATVQYTANGFNVTAAGTSITVAPGADADLKIIGGDDFSWTWSPATELSATTGTEVTANPTASRTYTATGVGACGTISKDFIVNVVAPPPPPPGGGGPSASTIPTMGEWWLITFALMAMCFGLLFMMNTQPKMAGMNSTTSMGKGMFHMPFEKEVFKKTLLYTMVGLVGIFAISISMFGYEMTDADVPGSLIAGPVFAYMVHLMLMFKDEE